MLYVKNQPCAPCCSESHENEFQPASLKQILKPINGSDGDDDVYN